MTKLACLFHPVPTLYLDAMLHYFLALHATKVFRGFCLTQLGTVGSLLPNLQLKDFAFTASGNDQHVEVITIIMSKSDVVSDCFMYWRASHILRIASKQIGPFENNLYLKPSVSTSVAIDDL